MQFVWLQVCGGKGKFSHRLSKQFQVEWLWFNGFHRKDGSVCKLMMTIQKPLDSDGQLEKTYVAQTEKSGSQVRSTSGRSLLGSVTSLLLKDNCTLSSAVLPSHIHIGLHTTWWGASNYVRYSHGCLMPFLWAIQPVPTVSYCKATDGLNNPGVCHCLGAVFPSGQWHSAALMAAAQVVGEHLMVWL